MADLMAGPNVPLTKAFLWCGWRTFTADWLLDPAHDLANPHRQASLANQLQAVDIAAALDCSTKSRAREIPRQFSDGRPAPQLLRSEEFPEAELAPAQTDDMACRWVLTRLQAHAERGGASVRENAWRSLQWPPQEQEMLQSGVWSDCRYAACAWGGARCKSQPSAQCGRCQPMLDCHRSHHSQEWQPSTVHGKRYFPSHEEAEYAAPCQEWSASLFLKTGPWWRT